MTHFESHQTHQPISALIYGNPHNFGVLLADSLLTQGIQVAAYLPKTISGNISAKIESHPLYQPFTKLNSSTNLDHFTYIFFLQTSTKKPKHLKKFLFSITSPQPKIAVVLFNHIDRLDNHTQSTLTTHQLLANQLDSTNQNIRAIHVNELFGDQISLSPHYPTGQLLHALSKNQIITPQNQHQLLYPLHSTDAISGIHKAVFSSGTQAKIFELAGNPISSFNLSLKIKSLVSHLNFSETTSVIPAQYLETISDQLSATQQELRWQPTANLDQALSSTIPWVLEQSQKTPSPTPQPPLPTPVFTAHTPTQSTKDETSGTSSRIGLSATSTPTPDSGPKTFSLNSPLSPPKPPPLPTTPPSKPNFSLPKPKLPPLRPTHPIFKWLLITTLFFSLLFSPFIYLGLNFYRIFNQLEDLQSSARAHHLTHIQTTTPNTIRLISHTQNLNQSLKPITALILGANNHQHLSQLLDLSATSTRALSSLSGAGLHAGNLADQLVNGVGDTKQTLSSLQTDTQTAYHLLSQLDAQLQDATDLKQIQAFSIGERLTIFGNLVHEYRPLLAGAHQLTSHGQDLLGFNGKQTYLVLLQNNAELRPTGGFIGSYALIFIENGQLLDIRVEDVYTADGQLRGHVEPPPAIKQHLGEAGWYLRDSNWDPHFPQSADNAVWFLQKEMNQAVDGVIGINMIVAQHLLEATGPIKVLDYDEQINAQNLFERAQYHTEINYFEGSTQKRDFLGKLTQALIDTILTSSEDVWFRVGEALLTSAQQNQLLVSVNHLGADQAFAQLGWTGSLTTPSCTSTTSSDCITDYLSINEANVGVNKSNYFVDRTINHQVTITPDNQITSTLTLSFKNDSPGDAWPGGRYKNYLRIYTPPGSTLESLTIDDQLISPNQIDISNQHQKTVFGFLTQTAPQSLTQVTLTYTLPQKLPTSSPTAYQLHIQKQPGVDSIPFKFNFAPPATHQLVTTTPKLDSTNSFTDNLTSDQTISIELTR